MIHYSLRCDSEHAFDGWFKDSGTFERQAQAKMVACPECGSVAVNRALMAPAIGRKRRVVDPAGVEQAGVEADVVEQAGAATVAAEPQGAPMSASVPPPKAGAALPDQVRAMLQKLRSEVEKNCENVGDQFAQEARAIHKGESKARGIYGATTPEQAEALADDGIEVARIPWVPRADG